MIARYSYRGLTWVDLESPTADEVSHLAEEYSLPATAAAELTATTLRSKVDSYSNCIYLVLHFPSINGTPEPEHEVDFVIGKDFVITARYAAVDPLRNFASQLEANRSLDGREADAGLIVVEMLRELYRAASRELEDLNDTITSIEDQIFAGSEESMVKAISVASRELLDCKRSLRFHHDVLVSYELAGKHLFGDRYAFELSRVFSEYNKLNSALENNRETLAELQRTNDSLLSTKQNSIMKKFTIISFVTFPLMLVTGIFGMNTNEGIIFIQDLADFFFVIGAMILTSFIMFLFFRHQRWL